ncbi:hypothetical protein [Clostridium hydrogeniformans]|uniref:hypothetical protein n=1 Tax=Clostridium hydrogeniformans TaxID=349933 RepID=UPI000553E36F|nr:hypothetical protein [Clostridium hydrogeniformans]
MFLITIPNYLVTPLISASAILLGSLVGAYFSWVISNKTTVKSIKEQYRIMEINRKYEEEHKCKKICVYANIIRLDVCTSIFQSIRGIKGINNNEEGSFYPIPINKSYSNLVAALSDKYTLKELSYLYQLYGIIEKLNYDILNQGLIEKSYREVILKDYEGLLKKIYGINYKEILRVDHDKISYKELYENNIIKEGYREVLRKLDYICILEQEKIGHK